MKRAFRNLMALTCASILYAISAHANGINPPRPAFSPVVKVECIDRKSNAALTANRATTRDSSMRGALEIKLDAKSSRHIKLSDLISISFTTTDIDKDGYVSALLETLEPKFEGKGSVRVRDNGKAISINGFDLSGKRTTLPLTECKKMAFESTSAEGSNEAPPAAAAK